MEEDRTQDEVLRYARDLGIEPNWGRWGDDDERGTLNLITPETILRASSTVSSGQVFNLGRTLDMNAPPYYPQSLDRAVKHEMVTSWSSNAGGDIQAASDQIHIQCHGLDNTHMDALCHIGLGGFGYNGRIFREMVNDIGASSCDMLAASPVVTRGVLLDVPRLRGVSHIEAGEPITESDLRSADIDFRPGDALIIRTGRALAGVEHRTAEDKYGRLTGLHPEAMRLVAELQPSLLGMDGSADNFPAVPGHRLPIHVLSLVILGIHLLHNLKLEDLATDLADKGRTDFMLIAAPLPLPGGTGSPLAPVAII
jgi:kynurenine formamidase